MILEILLAARLSGLPASEYRLEERPATVTGLPRIGIRIGPTGRSEFYDKSSGLTFIPRGNNYIRLREVGPGSFDHVTFEPGEYDSAGARAALAKMRADGYTVVRVFLNDYKLDGGLTTPGIDPARISNLVGFLGLATENGIHVILTPGAGFIPPNYYPITYTIPHEEHVESVNNVLLSAGYVKAYRAFVTDILLAIKSSNAALMSTIFSVDIRNESNVWGSFEPFSLPSGLVTLGDGRTYDMGNADSRQMAVDNNVVSSTNLIVAGIKGVDPEILTTASVFCPLQVGRSGYDGVAPNANPLAPARVSAVESSSVDYVDVHPYPAGPSVQLADLLHSCQVGAPAVGGKPRVMGEFGAFKNFYPSAVSAAIGMMNVEIESCTSFGFEGWLLWTWDAPDALQGLLWSAVDGVGPALAPADRPNPCSADAYLLDGRFEIQVNWSVPAQSRSGVGVPISLTPDTSGFWFFDSSNVELVIKVLDGRPVNGNFWVFAGGLTNVNVVITVTDTQTGAVKTYTNPQNTPFQPIQDTGAFAGSATTEPSETASKEASAARAAAEQAAEVSLRLERELTPSPLPFSRAIFAQAPCVTDATTLCLSASRFRVTAAWQSPTASGQGSAVSLSPDTGYFWFFNSANVEMIVKVLDACSINTRKWVFAGGLTNVNVVLTVTDTQTGAVRTYVNPQSTAFQPVQDTLAFSTCP